jgi:hypothetical protein
MTDREHDLAMLLLPLDGYIAYLHARQEDLSHMYGMQAGWKACADLYRANEESNAK